MASATPGDGGAAEPPTVNDANTVPIVEAPNGQEALPGPPATILKASTTKTPTAASELLRVDAGNVEATTVAMERSGAEKVVAQRVIMTNSGAKTLDARSAQLDRSGVVTLRGEHAVLHGGSAVGVVANEVRLVKSRAAIVTAKSATIEEGARILVYTGPASPEVRPAVDTAGAAAFGAGLGLALLLLGSLVRRIVR